jgi:hypothetical protein
MSAGNDMRERGLAANGASIGAAPIGFHAGTRASMDMAEIIRRFRDPVREMCIAR